VAVTGRLIAANSVDPAVAVKRALAAEWGMPPVDPRTSPRACLPTIDVVHV
jgi:hypothetical protein